MIRELTCIVCPKGCQLKVELDNNDTKKVLSVSGHTCKRGEAYAMTECVAPKRVVTSTAPLLGGGVVPVKTNGSIPKELMFECVKLINKVRVAPDAPIGTVIISDVLGTGIDVVTTRNAKA
jgi:CxxC motif-containing protein